MDPLTQHYINKLSQDWILQLSQKRRFKEEDLLELQEHLLDLTDDYIARGYVAELAFRLSVEQLGDVSKLAKEYDKLIPWYNPLSKAGSACTAILTSKRAIAFGVLFVIITIGGILRLEAGMRKKERSHSTAVLYRVHKPFLLQND